MARPRQEQEELDATSDGLTVHTPESLLANSDVVDALDPAVIKAFEMAKQAEILEKQLAATQAKLDAHLKRERLTKRLEACTPTIISSRDTHPNECFDLCAGYSPHQLLASIAAAYGQSDEPFDQGCIVLVPVILYEAGVQDPRRPYIMKGDVPLRSRDGSRKIPNLSLGQTQVRESYLTVEAEIDGVRKLVSVQAYCNLSVNPFGNPDQIHRRLEESQSRMVFQTNGADAHHDPEDDGNSSRNSRAPFAEREPISSSTAFVPSLAGKDNAPNLDEDPQGKRHRTRRRQLKQG